MTFTGTNRKRARGFTLLEVLTVILVISALATIAAPHYLSYVRRSRAVACLANRRHIELAEQEQYLRTGRADLSIPAKFKCPSGGEYVWICNDPADSTYPRIGCSVHAWQDTGAIEAGQTLLFASAFDSMDPLVPLIGNWAVTSTGLVPKNPGEHRIAFGDRQWTDYTVTIDATLDSGPGYGIYFRADGEKQISGYCFQYDPGYGSGEFLVRKVINGREQSPFQRAKFPSGFSAYHQSREVSIRTEGQTTTIKVDGAVVFEFQDNAFPTGMAGLRTWSNTSASFHNVQIAGAAGSEP